MKVTQAVDFHLQYHTANSKKNTVKTCEFVLQLFTERFAQRDLASISQEEVLAEVQTAFFCPSAYASSRACSFND